MRKRLGLIWNKARKIKKRWLIIGALVLIVLFLILRPKSNQANKPEFATATSGSISVEVSGAATLDGKTDVTLHFQTGGQLASLNVKDGERVSSGEVVASLDARELNASLQQAENTLNTDQANVDKVLDDIHLSQYGNGGFGNVGSSNETQTQRDDRINAQEARDSALDSVKSTQVALQNATIFSPIDGVVTSAPLSVGEDVLPTDTVAQIVDFSQKVVDTDIDESDISTVKLGQSAQFTLNSYGDKVFNGTVLDISPLTHTTSDGATVITVKISADDPSIESIAGLGGTANIITAQKNNVLIIPLSALRSDNTVLVPNGKTFKAAKVTTGLQNDTNVEITSGLSEGEKVVTNPGVVKVSN